MLAVCHHRVPLASCLPPSSATCHRQELLQLAYLLPHFLPSVGLTCLLLCLPVVHRAASLTSTSPACYPPWCLTFATPACYPPCHLTFTVPPDFYCAYPAIHQAASLQSCCNLLLSGSVALAVAPVYFQPINPPPFVIGTAFVLLLFGPPCGPLVVLLHLFFLCFCRSLLCVFGVPCAHMVVVFLYYHGRGDSYFSRWIYRLQCSEGRYCFRLSYYFKINKGELHSMSICNQNGNCWKRLHWLCKWQTKTT